MAAGRIVLPPYMPARDRNGRLVSGARLTVYLNGTTTKANIYANSGLSTAQANPVIANASGQFPAIWCNAGTVPSPVLYTLAISGPAGENIGNPSVFDAWQPSVDGESAQSALAEAAAQSAQAYYEDIVALEGEADPSIAIATRAAKAANLSDLTDPESARENIGADVAANVFMTQIGSGAVNEDLQSAVRILYVRPEQFGAGATYNTAVDESAAVQAAYDSAANWPSAGYARRVLLSRFYNAKGIKKRPYVTTVGVGLARSGFMPVSSSGPVLICDSTATPGDDSSAYLDEFENFRIDGTYCTGTAYAILLKGQKHVRFTRVGFWNFMATSEHAVQIRDLGYAMTFDQCYWHQNRRHAYLATTAPAVSFPTTITHVSCTFEAENTGAAWAHEAIFIKDASGITYDQNCIFQQNDQKYLFQVENGSTSTTTSLHRWINCYFEDNGGVQTGAQTWRLLGASGNPLTVCTISGNKMHGAAPDGGHIYASRTQQLIVRDNSVPPNHTWLVNGGNNSGYDIDARFVGLSELQTARYNTTNFAFTDGNAVTTPQGDILVPTVAKQSTGRFNVDFNRAFKSTGVVVIVTAFDAGGEPLLASGYVDGGQLNRLKVIINAAGGTTPATPSRVQVSVTGEIDP